MTNHCRRDNQACTSSHRERTQSGRRTCVKVARSSLRRQRSTSNIRMDPVGEQFEGDAKPAYFDPDAPDMSEQQFAASLEAEIEKPAFVVDDEDPPPAIPVADCVLPTPSNCGDSRPRLSDRAKLDDFVSETASLNASENPDWRDQVSAKVN